MLCSEVCKHPERRCFLNCTYKALLGQTLIVVAVLVLWFVSILLCRSVNGWVVVRFFGIYIS